MDINDEYQVNYNYQMYLGLKNADKVKVLDLAIDYMEQSNARSKELCISLAIDKLKYKDKSNNGK